MMVEYKPFYLIKDDCRVSKNVVKWFTIHYHVSHVTVIRYNVLVEPETSNSVSYLCEALIVLVPCRLDPSLMTGQMTNCHR